MSDKQTWKEPKTATIRLLDGTTAEAEVNGLSEDCTSAFAYYAGQEIKVMLVDGEWRENPFLDEENLP